MLEIFFKMDSTLLANWSENFRCCPHWKSLASWWNSTKSIQHSHGPNGLGTHAYADPGNWGLLQESLGEYPVNRRARGAPLRPSLGGYNSKVAGQIILNDNTKIVKVYP